MYTGVSIDFILCIAESPLARTRYGVKKIAYEMIMNRNYSFFNFFQLLQKSKRWDPGLLYSRPNLNLLHSCIDKGKLTFLPVFVQLGCWQMLSSVRQNGTHDDYRGITPKEIAESKHSRKPLDEFNRMEDWNSSLSPLMKACRDNDKTKVRYLLQQGGHDLFHSDFNGGNALYWAVVNGEIEIVEFLMAAGLDPNVRTNKRENLLHVACSVGNSHLIPLLLGESLNIDPQEEDINHKTPIER